MSTSIAIRSADTAINIQELQTIGQVFAKSGFFSDAKDAGQAIVKIMAGQELGFPPIASMTGVYIVKGKVSLSANLMAAAIKRSGKYNFKVRELSPEVCKIEFFENGESIGVSEFTKADAKIAETQNMNKFPRNMLYARAMSNGAKWFCADIFGGPVYTPEEMGARVNEEGEVIDMEPIGAPNQRAVPDDPRQIATDAHSEINATLLSLWKENGKSEAEWPAYFEKNIKSLTYEQKQERLEKWQTAALAARQPKAEPVSGLDQWQCTRETGSRALALEVIEATKRIEAHVAPDIWKRELAVFFPEYEVPISRKTLSADDCRKWVEYLNDWAKAKAKAEKAA